MQPHEIQLIISAQEGDAAAAEELANQYWDRIFRYLFRLIGNWSDAEDIAQETFLRAFKNLKGYRPNGPFHAWLMRIATNLFIDMRKARRNRDVLSDDIALASGATFWEPDQKAQDNELVAAVWERVQELTNEQQAVIIMRGVERIEYHKIAKLLNVSESTARWHMYEARRILRRKLNAAFGEEGVLK